MPVDLATLVPPAAVETIRTAGLHKVVGEMAGVGEMTVAKAAGLIGQKAYIRRKTAQLVADGIISLAAVEKTAMPEEAAARLRASVLPATKDVR